MDVDAKVMAFDEQSAVSPYDFVAPSGWSAIVSDILAKFRTKRINCTLDIGCGPGHFSLALRDIVAAPVVGIDFSRSMLKRASTVVSGAVSLIQADTRSLPLKSASVDLVLLRYLLHHVESVAHVISEVSRVLSDGGLLLVETSDPEQLSMQADYTDFPSIAAIDLPRWPTKMHLAELMAASEICVLECVEVDLVRDWIVKDQYLARLERWKLEGGGTSFWRLFDEEQRCEFVRRRSKLLISDETLLRVPILSQGMIMIGRKCGARSLRNLGCKI